ncbi:nuclear transport factor 2 family protein [Ramlibacter sp.]|uniref:nuclear transport factor 2 family protein n=1 Tax=Ramlibacter sp. TaxID=1917967 RepID=UPI003D0A00E1
MKTIDDFQRFFEDFSPADLPALGDWYTEDAYFKDPFNEVRGIAAITRVYAHMFETLDEPRFRIVERIGTGANWVLVWEFTFRTPSLGKGMQVVRGASHLRLDASDGRIAWHRDYWDAAEEFYAKVPVLGALMRWLRKRGSASAAPAA